MTSEERFTEAFRALTSALGLFGSDKDRSAFVADQFNRMHRTTQQCFMRVVIMPVLRQMASNHEQGWCDGRNQDSCRIAHKMVSALDDSDSYIPFV